MDLRTRAGTLVLSAACCAASCRSDSPTEPKALDVRVVYVSRLPAGCPDIGNPTLWLYGRDIGMCCVDACNYPPVLEDILPNRTKLTKVVHDGLPAGATAALEFTVTGSGTVRN